jgi:hypothetical protein
MEIDGDMFEEWKDDLIEQFFGNADALGEHDEIMVSVHEETTGKETIIWNLSTVVDEDALEEEYDVIIDALTHPAQVFQSGMTIPSFDEFRKHHDSLPVNSVVDTESITVRGSFHIRVTASNVS